MRFNLKKQPAKLATQFRVLPITELEAHKLLPSTVYLYLEINQKFLALKEPFDFFTEAELEKFSKQGTFHVPEHFDIAEPFRESGKRVRSMLEWSGGEGEELEPSSYEMSDSIIRQVAGLWAPLDPTRKDSAGIETYFAAIFAHEIVSPLPVEWLEEVRSQDLDLYLVSVMRAAFSVFIALHLGFCDRNRLDELYGWVYTSSAKLAISNRIAVTPEMKEIGKWVSGFISKPGVGFLASDLFDTSKGRVPEQLKNRMKRVCSELILKDARLQSIYADPWVLESEVDDAA